MCDDDGDGAPKIGPGCCAIGDPACDCDDDNADVFPNQGAWFAVPRPGIQDSVEKWDYNCDGAVSKEYPFVATPCNALNLCLVDNNSFHGNQGEYDCGVPGIQTDCVLLLSCASEAMNLACH